MAKAPIAGEGKQGLTHSPGASMAGPGHDPRAAAQQEKKNYIGSVLSLISKQEIRYVGTLIMVNPQDQTLVLQNVRSYGSEGRRGGGSEEVPGSTKLYQSIIFRASELKDFVVTKESSSEFKDPAILSAESRAAAGKEAEKAESPAREVRAGHEVHEVHEGEEKKAYAESREPQEYHPYSYRYSRGYSPRRARGSPTRGHRPLAGEYAVSSDPSSQALKDKFKDDFDFEGMNKRFLDEQPEDEKAPQSPESEKYNKGKSFYDTLSNSLKEKNTTGGDTGFDYVKQRKIDAETFGLQQMRGRGRPYEQYSRGGRGGYERSGSYTRYVRRAGPTYESNYSGGRGESYHRGGYRRGSGRGVMIEYHRKQV